MLAGPSTPVERHSADSLDTDFEAVDFRIRIDAHPLIYHSSDESYFFDFIMEKVKSTKFAHFVDRLAVESEPGLTNAQLMLNNHDLKPVETERRQWGPWNFVGFWYAWFLLHIRFSLKHMLRLTRRTGSCPKVYLSDKC